MSEMEQAMLTSLLRELKQPPVPERIFERRVAGSQVFFRTFNQAKLISDTEKHLLKGEEGK